MVSLLFLTAVGLQQEHPVERYRQYHESAPALQVDLKLTSPQLNAVGRGRMSVGTGFEQSYRMAFSSIDMELVQDSESRVTLLYHKDKTYEIFGRLGASAQPHPDWNAMVKMAYPLFLASSDIDQAGQILNLPTRSDGETRWKKVGVRRVGLNTIDKIRLSAPDGGTPGITIEIDQLGRPWSYHLGLSSPTGRFEVTVAISNWTRQVTNKDQFKTDPPLGYTPLNIPYPHFPISPGHRFQLADLPDGLSGKDISLSSLYGKNGVVLYFTDPSCEVSKKAEDEMRQVRSLLEKDGIKMVEISLSTVKPSKDKKDSKRQLIWDKSGKIERSVDIPATPWLFRVASDGIIVSAWGGWKPGSAAKIAKTLAGVAD
jgi:peroxiredoxin